jgi:hypothetical protein
MIFNYKLLFFLFALLISILVCWSIKDMISFDSSASIKMKSSSIKVQQPEEEKFITYLPHSGLHNQRISLINAMIVAKALNRTLLMPEMNIGRSTYWGPFRLISQQMSICPTLKYNKQNRKQYKQLNCLLYENYKPIMAEELFDLSAAHSIGIKTEQRLDMKLDYINRHYLARHPTNTTIIEFSSYRVNDTKRYSWRLFDDEQVMANSTNDKMFQNHMALNELKQRQEIYIEFGSLFGNSRLILNDPNFVWTKEYLHRQIALNHTLVNQFSQEIISLLGPTYQSVHLRQGDGIFTKIIRQTINEIENKLSFVSQHKSEIPASLSTTEIATLSNKIVLAGDDDRLQQCKSIQYLNIPQLKIIYIATDSHSPKTQFIELFNKYPCLFTLNYFISYAKRNGLKSAKGVDPSLFPMIDAEVASRSKLFIVGTPHSTFSAYVRYRHQFFKSIDFFK